MRKSALTLAAVLALTPGIANAAEQACLTQKEFSSLAGYALPSVIGGVGKRCKTTLTPEAFLNTGGEKLAAQYAARKSAAWPGAKAAFVKLSASSKNKAADVFRSLPDDSLMEVVDVMLEGMVSQEIPLDKCGTIDNFVRLLAPLPPENTAELIGLTVGIVSKEDGGKVGKIAMCSG